MGYIGSGISRFNTADELTVTGDAVIDTTTLVVDSTNNRVGIGTSSPDSLLELYKAGTSELMIGSDNAGTAQLSFYEGDSSTKEGFLKYDGANNNVVLGTSGAANAVVVARDTGRVGIGTASPTLDGSLAGLSVNASGTVLQVNDGDGATLKLTDPATGANRGFGITLQGTEAAISNCESGPLRFGTGNTERMRILASGGLTFNGDTAAANALDDYEEGTWTPTITGGTSNPSSTATGSGIYTKVGRVVTVQAFASNQNTTGASGHIIITGLPFTPNSSNDIAGVGAVMSEKMFGMADGDRDDTTTICAWAETSTTQVRFYGSRGAGQGWYAVPHSAGTGRYLRFTVTYAV